MSAYSLATLSALNDLSADTGRDLDWGQLRQQIGRMTVLAISGGRVVRLGQSRVALPVSNGYFVLITIEADDTYSVSRVRIHGGKVFHKGSRTDVYCDDIGGAAYYASCFRSHDVKSWTVAS